MSYEAYLILLQKKLYKLSNKCTQEVQIFNQKEMSRMGGQHYRPLLFGVILVRKIGGEFLSI